MRGAGDAAGAAGDERFVPGAGRAADGSAGAGAGLRADAVASLQWSRLGVAGAVHGSIQEPHHELSHLPDSDAPAMDKLTPDQCLVR